MTPEEQAPDSGWQEPAVAMRPTPPISKGGARAAISARMARLGYAPRQIDPSATDKLIASAGGSDRKLRAILDTVLFLAASEGAALIDARLVERALLGGSASKPATHRGLVFGRGGRSAILAGAGAAILLVGVLVWRGLEPVRPAGDVAGQAEPGAVPVSPGLRHMPAVATGNSVAPPIAAVPSAPREGKGEAPPQLTATRGVDQPLPKVAAAPAAAPVVPPTTSQGVLPPLSAPVEIDPLALPPRAVAGQPPTVSIIYVDRAGVGSRLRSLTERLHQVGISEVTTRVVPDVVPGQVVAYFTPTDSGLARKVTEVLQTEGWPGLSAQTLRPGLARRSAARHGVIEVRLP